MAVHGLNVHFICERLLIVVTFELQIYVSTAVVQLLQTHKCSRIREMCNIKSQKI